MELLSPWHLILILAVVVLLFGGRKIPEVMRGMGEGIKSFKDGMRGDTTAAGSHSQVTPSLSLAAAPNPAPFGQPITLTALLNPAPIGANPGSVSFFNGATLLGSTSVSAAGIATVVSTALPAGTQTVTAAYTGGTNLTAASAALPVTVNSSVAVNS